MSKESLKRKQEIEELEKQQEEDRKKMEELQKTADKSLIRQIKAKIDKLKRDELAEQLQVQEYIKRGLQQSDAEKLAELGEMLRISSQRIELIKDFPDNFTEKTDRLEKTQELHKKNLKIFNDLFTEAQKRSIQKIDTETKDKEPKPTEPEKEKEIEKKLSALEINKEWVEKCFNDFTKENNIPESYAREMANLEGELLLLEEKIELLKSENPGLKNREKMIEDFEKEHERKKEELLNLAKKGEEQNKEKKEADILKIKETEEKIAKISLKMPFGDSTEKNEELYTKMTQETIAEFSPLVEFAHKQLEELRKMKELKSELEKIKEPKVKTNPTEDKQINKTKEKILGSYKKEDDQTPAENPIGTQPENISVPEDIKNKKSGKGFFKKIGELAKKIWGTKEAKQNTLITNPETEEENESGTNTKTETKNPKDETQQKTPAVENKEKIEQTLNLYDFKWESDYYYTPSGRFSFAYNDVSQDITIVQENFEYKKRKYFNNILGEKRIKLKIPKWRIDIDKDLGNIKLYDRSKKVNYNTQEEALNEINKILEANLEIKEVILDEKKVIKETLSQIQEDKKNKKFEYFVTEKIRSQTRSIFRNSISSSDEGGVVDLRHLKSGEFEAKFIFPIGIRPNYTEVFFECNIFGFIKVIKNKEEIKDKEGNINQHSEKALYKIIGPDGEIVADDIPGYDKANEIYKQSTEEYKEKLLIEFNKLSK